MYDFLSIWCWLLFCLSHFFICYFELYTQSTVRLLMADLCQYAIILLFVLNSRLWIMESVVFMILYFSVGLGMLYNA
jgi:hypothetical protein